MKKILLSAFLCAQLVVLTATVSTTTAAPSVTTLAPAPDTTPPVVSFISIAESVVDVSCGSRFVEVQWRVDDVSPVSTNISLQWTAGGSNGLSSTPRPGVVDKSPTGATYVSYIKIDKFTSPGTFAVTITARATDQSQQGMYGINTGVVASVVVLNNPTCGEVYPTLKIKTGKTLTGMKVLAATYSPKSKFWLLGISQTTKSKKICKVTPLQKGENDRFLLPAKYKVKGLKVGNCVLSLSYWNPFQETEGIRSKVTIKVTK